MHFNNLIYEKLNMINNPIPTIIIAGPTASGKTKLSINLARKLNGEIINADAMQIFEGFEILKAMPTKEEKCGIEHHLFGFVSIKEKYSVAKWLHDANAKIIEVNNRNKVPIFVGGSGMYLNAATKGLSIIPSISLQTRMKATDLYERKGFDYIYKKLIAHDTEGGLKININDRQRLIRAYEVFLETGKPIWWWQSRPNLKPIINSSLKILISPSKEKLYPKINERVDRMVNDGLLLEVKNVFANNLSPDLQSFKAIGINYFFDFLKGETSLEEAINKTKQESRRYAKRQMTWFKNSFISDLLHSNLYRDNDELVENAIKAFNLLSNRKC